jgi:hypothetical protein
MSKDKYPGTFEKALNEFSAVEIAAMRATAETNIVTGGNNDYYLVTVAKPKRLAPYQAECEDIIEALQMTFAEGTVLKALWRSCAARTFGLTKPGADHNFGIYDAEKIAYYGERMVAARTKLRDAKQAKNATFGQMTTTKPVGNTALSKECIVTCKRNRASCSLLGCELLKDKDV